MKKNIVKIDPKIKREIAEKVMLENSAGYSRQFQGSYYLVNGIKIMHCQSNAPWAPWADNARVISLDFLINEIGGASKERANFSDEDFNENECTREEYDSNALDFIEGYIPSQYDQAIVDAHAR